MIYLNLFLMAFVAVFVSDLSGFMDSCKEWIGRLSGRHFDRLPPLDCPLCLVWWVCLAYAACCGGLNIRTIALIAALALLARPFAELVRAALEMLLAVCRRFADFIDRRP